MTLSIGDGGNPELLLRIRPQRELCRVDLLCADPDDPCRRHWGRAGLPDNPRGWLLKVALRKAIDRLRTGARDARRAADIALLAKSDETESERIAVNRLRLIFTCCHPALEPKSRVALTLRILGGLTTPEIAAAFLDSNTAMGALRGPFQIKSTITACHVIGPTPD